MPQTLSARRRLLLLLIAVAAISPLGINIYLPSMPGMARMLEVNYATIQLTLSVYLAAVAVGQLIVGPLSDRFGRRPVLLIGLVMYVIGSIICGLADNMFWLNMGRVIQAVGGCAGITLSRTIVRDLYDRNQSASMIGYLTMGMSVAPMVAPALGGVLELAFGWRASFFFLAGFAALVTLATWSRLQETNPYLRQHQQARRAKREGGNSAVAVSGGTPAPTPLLGPWGSYWYLIRRGSFWGYSLTTSFSSGVFFAFVAGAAYIMIELRDRSPLEYGIYFGSVSAGYMLGSFLSGRYAMRVGPDRLIAVGTILNLGGVLLMMALYAAGLHHPLALFLPMGVVAISNGLVLPSAIAGAVSVKPEIAGAASGLAGSLQIGFAALVAPFVGWLLAANAWPMFWVMMGSSLLAILSYRVMR